MLRIVVLVSMLALAIAPLAGTAGPAAAHPHEANGQVIANGQNHPKFEILSGVDFDGDGVIEGLSCDSFGAASGGGLGPAGDGVGAGPPRPAARGPGRG